MDDLWLLHWCRHPRRVLIGVDRFRRLLWRSYSSST
jgi:hypothetical protein